MEKKMTTQTDDTILVKDAPDIPGLRFRKFRGDADIPEMVKVLNVVDRADGNAAAHRQHRWPARKNSNP